MNIVLAGAGGMSGAILRYILSLIPLKTDFPFVTLTINILGSFAIGFINGYALIKKPSEKLIVFLKTGVCGGFTTFSTFSLENLKLIQNGKEFVSLIYMITSFAGCIFGVKCGETFAQKIFL